MAEPEAVNILVVDDVPEKILALGTILEGPGQHVVTAQSGREALRRLLEQEFAVILLDVNMPDMDGFETAALIRQRKQTAGTPIIFVTGYGDELHAAQGYSLGAVDYILTPVVPDILRTKVNVFVELFRMREQVRLQAEERVALAREQALRAAAEEARWRWQFLAEATTTLTDALDIEARVQDLLRLVVPRLADFASVIQVGPAAQAWRSELAWSPGPGQELRTATLTADEAPRDELRAALERVLISGRPEELDDMSLSRPPEGGGTGVSSLCLRWAVVLPLRARGRVLGALALGGADRVPLAAEDRDLAEDLAGRAAIALDNARLYRDIQERDRRKDEFLALLGHELRNPLAPVRSAVEILRRVGGDHPQLTWASGVIERQVHHIVRLVDDLLDVSRITRGVVNLRPTRVEVAPTVARAVETVRPLLDERRHCFELSLPDEPLFVIADPTRLEQVVANLLHNAVKYTEPGGHIELGVRADGADVEVHVRDNGIGIPPDMIDQIFEPFTQVDRSLDRSQGGLGIGLTLVQRLVALQGGSVRARSDGPGQGSEFVVRLPLAPICEANGHKPSGEAGTAAARVRSSCRVLVVDDNADAAQTLAILLRAAGHTVRLALDGPHALQAAQDFDPEAVFLDIGLPGMDGYAVAKRLRAAGGAMRLLIALTGYGQAEDQRRAFEAGFDRHFVKPVDPAILLELLSGLKEQTRATVAAG